MSSEVAPQPGRVSRLKVWILALRAPFLTASLIPALLGAFAAYWKTGMLGLDRLALTVGAVGCVHLGANLANDFFDEITGCDRLNPEPTPFSGGSRVIQQGLVGTRSMLAASLVFLGLGLAQGLVLNAWLPGNRVLLVGLLGIFCAVVYTAVPFRLSYRGWGEAVVFVAFGPLAVMGGYLCQAGSVGRFAALVSLPAGFLVLSILLVNEVLDLTWDGRAGKRTLVVVLGRRPGYMLFLVTYLGAYAWMALGLILRIYPVAAWLVFLPLVMWFPAILAARASDSRSDLVRASRLTILSHTFSLAVLAASYLLRF